MVCEHGSPTEFHILDKRDGKHIATYQVNNFCFFHIGNAYDYIDPKTGDVNVHVDIVSYRDEHYPYMDHSLLSPLDPKKPLQNGTPVRYQMDSMNKANPTKLYRGSVAPAILGLPCELPRVSKPASMDPDYRYTYAMSGIGASSSGMEAFSIGRFGNGWVTVHPTIYGSLIKSDWNTGLFKLWTPSNGESCPVGA
ncbi:hypothetical protein BN1723_017767, partial [Verticillium longisporum]